MSPGESGRARTPLLTVAWAGICNYSWTRGVRLGSGEADLSWAASERLLVLKELLKRLELKPSVCAKVQHCLWLTSLLLCSHLLCAIVLCAISLMISLASLLMRNSFNARWVISRLMSLVMCSKIACHLLLGNSWWAIVLTHLVLLLMSQLLYLCLYLCAVILLFPESWNVWNATYTYAVVSLL